MPALISAALLPLIVSSPLYYSGPLHPLMIDDHWRQLKSRRQMIDAIVRPADGAGAGDIRQIGVALMAAVEAHDGSEVDYLETPPDGPVAGLGACLQPFVSSAATFMSVNRAVVPGDVVLVTWYGIPWRMAKIFLGIHRPLIGKISAVFLQTTPLMAYSVPLEFITYVAPATGYHVDPAELPAEARELIPRLDQAPVELPSSASFNAGFGATLDDIFQRLRALPADG